MIMISVGPRKKKKKKPLLLSLLYTLLVKEIWKFGNFSIGVMISRIIKGLSHLTTKTCICIILLYIYGY